jgi:hypothetical protein
MGLRELHLVPSDAELIPGDLQALPAKGIWAGENK